MVIDQIDVMLSNSLIVHGLKGDEYDSLVPMLKARLEDHGGLLRWIDLRSVGRIMLVFNDFEAASIALKLIVVMLKHELSTAGVVYGPLTDLEAEIDHLNIPDQGRLWLISPPAEISEGWIQTTEEKPNTQSHQDPCFNERLAAAIRQLQVEDENQAELDPGAKQQISAYGKSKRPIILHEGSSESPSIHINLAE